MSETEELRDKIDEIIASALSDNDIRPRTSEVLRACKDAGLKFAYCRWTKDIGKDTTKISAWNVAPLEVE